MATLKLTGGKPATSTRAPKRKPAAKSTPKRKPAATTRATTKPAATTENGGNGRTPRLPEGMSKSDFNRLVKDMQKANAVKVAAADKLAEAQATVNQMALDMLDAGIQMSVIKDNLVLSRQWMYKLMEDAGMPTSRQAAPKRKPAAKKRPAAKQAASTPARKPPAARKAPARKRPPAATGRGRVRLAA